jgi:hypothetical protein
MSNQAPVFADRIVNLAVSSGTVRLEFGHFAPSAEKGSTPQLISSHQLVMPIDGFAASFGTLEALMKKLLDEGIVKKQTAPAISN